MLTEATITWEELEALVAHEGPVPPETVDVLGDEIVRCEVLLGGALYRQLLCLRLFDAAGGWCGGGWKSLEAWLGVKLGLPYSTASEKVRVARSLSRLPRLNEAFRQGRLSYTKVRALHDVATPENEASLIKQARYVSGEQLRRLVEPLRAAVRRAKGTQAEREEQRRVVFAPHPAHDLVEARATLLPEEAALLRKALEVGVELGIKHRLGSDPSLATAESAAAESDQQPLADEGTCSDPERGFAASGDVRTSAAAAAESQRLAASEACSSFEASDLPASVTADSTRRPFGFADALVFIAESFLANPPRKGVPPGRRELLIHTVPDLSVGVLESGEALGPETVRRLACDGATARIERGPEGEVLDVGRRTRRINRRLEKALVVRDRCCSFPGCTRTALLDAHHLEHWAEGGKTTLNNLTRLCRFHHRLVHEGEWTVERRADGSIAFLDPQGVVVDRSGRLPELEAAQAHAALLAECGRLSLDLDPTQLAAEWGGERIPDYGYAIAGLVEQCGFNPEREGELPPAVRWLLNDQGGGSGDGTRVA